jgi:hypothetical protein
MFDFTFSGRIPTSFLRLSLIPERMELGIFHWSEILWGGNPKRSCLIEIENWSEVKFKKVFTKTTRFMVMISFFVSMNWRKGLQPGYVCLKPSPLGRHPKRASEGSLGRKGSQRLTLVLGLFGLCPRVPLKPKLFRTFKASEVSRMPVKVASVSMSAHIMLALET